jgi:hypothetical protein
VRSEVEEWRVRLSGWTVGAARALGTAGGAGELGGESTEEELGYVLGLYQSRGEGGRVVWACTRGGRKGRRRNGEGGHRGWCVGMGVSRANGGLGPS